MMVLMVPLLVPLVMELVIFGLREQNRDGFRRLVYAATAKSPGASSRFPRKLTSADVTDAIAKEIGSLKLRSGADVFSVAGSPMILVRY